MTDRWLTYSVIPEGGLIENLSPLVQGETHPGSLLDARNFEPSPVGGYRKIKGYEKFDPSVVPGTGQVIAVFVFRNTVLALRNLNWYVSSGAGWTLIHTLANTPGDVLSTRYNWSSTDNIIIADGANAPIHYDGTTLTPMISGNTVNGTVINANTASNIFAAQSVQEFHQHMFFNVGPFTRFSAPNTEGVVDGTGGSGEFITGSEKLGMAPWREQLFLFGNDRIGRVIGQNATDFIYDNVTNRVGVVDPRTIQEMNSDIYYLAFDGVRTISGTVKNETLELGSTTRSIPETIESLTFRRTGREVHALAIRDTSQYRLFVGNVALEDFEGEGLLGGIRLNSQGGLNLEWFKLRGINASCSDSGLFLTEEFVIHGGFDGYVYRQEIGNSFDGANINAFLRFPYWTIETPEIRKVMYKAKIYLQANSVIDPTLGWNFNYNISSLIQPPNISLGTGAEGFSTYGDLGSTYGTATYGSDFPVNADVNLIGSGDNVSFTISSDDITTNYSVQSLTIEYGLASRR